MPSAAASSSSRISGSVERASASSSAPRSASPSRSTSATPRSSRACLRSTTEACSRGRRSAAAGTMVAATRATSPPTSASVHRVKAPPVPGSSATTKIDWIAAWLTSIVPPSSRIPAVIAMATTSPSCHAPVPSRATSRSASSTPTATPTVISATRRSRWP